MPSPGCAAAALEVARREFSDPAYFAVHRLTVAAYTLQHPDTASEHSVAVHLAVLQWAAGHDPDPDGLRRHVRWAAAELRRRPPGRLRPPPARGALTIADVVAATSAAEHCTTVRSWAAQVGAAWREHRSASPAP